MTSKRKVKVSMALLYATIIKKKYVTKVLNKLERHSFSN